MILNSCFVMSFDIIKALIGVTSFIILAQIHN